MQTARIERTILSNLIHNEEFVRKVMPFLRPEYFHDTSEKLVFSTISASVSKYNKLPSSEQIVIDMNTQHNIAEPEFNSAVDIINSLNTQNTDTEWLTDATESSVKKKQSTMQSLRVFR